MEERARSEEEMTQEKQNVLAEDLEKRLYAAGQRIVLDPSAKERIMEGVKGRKRNRRRLASRIPAAVLAACLVLSTLCFVRMGFMGEDVMVYAATEEYGWQKLVEGERILLKKEPFDPYYYPYKCTFRLEVQGNYLYDRQFTTLRDDYIGERGGIIEWFVAPDRPEDAGRVMRGKLSLWIVNENRERLAALEVELTKEDGECYAELKRVWESEAYKNRKGRR